MVLRSIDPPKANPESLLGIMRDAHEGTVVIPEFQRSFVWGREGFEDREGPGALARCRCVGRTHSGPS